MTEEIEVYEKIGQLKDDEIFDLACKKFKEQNADASKKVTDCHQLEEKYKVLSRDYQILSEEYIDLREENKRLKSNLKQMRKKVDILNVLYQHIQEQYNLLNAITESFRNQNEDLERAITSAISYLACMDRISDKESNEQLAMDVLNEALGEKK